jgi:hypothetical protein
MSWKSMILLNFELPKMRFSGHNREPHFKLR